MGIPLIAWIMGSLYAVYCGWMIYQFIQRRALRDRRMRRDPRRCVSCGYDLRGTPIQCPECGIAVSPLYRWGDPELDPHKLRDDWPATPIAVKPPAPGGQRVIIFSTRNRNEASLLAEHLEIRGIWSRLDTPVETTWDQQQSPPRSFLHVVVCQNDEAEARAVVEHFRRVPT